MTNVSELPNTYRAGPDEDGRFGIYGGRFVAETLMPLILELEAAYDEAKTDPEYQAELTHFNTHYAGRPSPLYFAERLTNHLGGELDCFHQFGSVEDQLDFLAQFNALHGFDLHAPVR